MDFHQIMTTVDRIQRTFSKNGPVVIVRNRRELVKAKLSHRFERRALGRLSRRITGTSLFAVQRAKAKAKQRGGPSPFGKNR